jgi:thiosulfate reductase cytochrome b subunit
MKITLQIISGLALVGTIGPALIYLAGAMDLDRVKGWMLFATVVWFVTVPLWMGRKRA